MSDDADNTQEPLSAKQEAFLSAYSDCGNVSNAAKVAGIYRTTHNRWLKKPEYAARFAVAKEDAGDSLEAEARRRAVNGVPEPVYYRGEKVGTVRRYSDVLLIFLLKGLRPEKYRDNYTAPASNDASEESNTRGLTIEQRRARVAALLERAAASRDGGATPAVGDDAKT